MKLNYSTLAHIFYKYMMEPDQTKVADALLGFIVNDPNNIEKERPDSSGDRHYFIDNTFSHNLFQGKKPVFPNIRKAAANNIKVRESAVDCLGDSIGDFISPDKDIDLYSAVNKLIQQEPDMSRENKEQFQKLYNRAEYDEFFAKAALYAISNPDNTPPKAWELNADVVGEMIEIINRLGRPVSIEIPENPSEDEAEYIQALLDAYSDDSGIQFEKISDLPDNYSSDLKDQRRYFYDAESLRMAERDTKILNGTNAFDDVDSKEYLENLVLAMYDELPASKAKKR